MLFIQHKEIGLAVEKQKALVSAVLSGETDGLLQLADNQASELSALGNVIIKTTREGTPVALELYRAAMEAGDDRGAFSYATLLYRHKMDEPRSLSILSELARKGHPYAQMNLAAMIMRSQPDKAAAASAVKLYELASKTIDKAYVELGRMYRFGYGVHQDHQKAFGYFSRGAAKGDPRCNFMLGVYYSSANNGGAVEEDQAKAFKYFQKAAMRGLPEAQYNVGFRFLKGHGVERNLYNAAEFLRMAATQGFQLAQLNLAAMYIQGDGVKRDLTEARAWLEKAAAQGGTMGKDAEKRLAELNGTKDGGKSCQIM
ncbi:hypothetical protein BX666DRAFT_1949917 [Dichotomocladium elegans]|nr:hypothetical protein BX666DRAFT_1949917 [Dichotomocladium elegans]